MSLGSLSTARSLFSLLSARQLARHPLRAALTVAGIALGVGAVVSIGLVNRSVTLGMRRAVEEMAGGAQLVVSGDRSGVPADLLEKVAHVEGVQRATPVIRQAVELRAVDGTPARGRLQIWAVDSLDDDAVPQSAFRREDLLLPDPLRFIAQPRSLIVTETFARQHGLEARLGKAVVSIASGRGAADLVVRGILRGADAGRAFGGRLGLMDAYSAQKVFGRADRFDEIQVQLAGSPSLEEVAAARERLSRLVGAGFEVERPLNRGRQSERIVHAWEAAIGLLSVVTLFVGGFLIHNTVSVSVAERRHEIGILRSLGMTRARVAAIFLGESAAMGVAGAALGLGAGIAGARGLLHFTTSLMSRLFLATAVEELRYSPGTLAAGVALGLALALLSALGPALSAAGVHPLEALRALPPERRRLRFLRAAGASGALLLALSLAGCLSPATRRSELLASATLLSLLFGFVLLTPVAVPLLLRLIAPLFERAGAVGQLAAVHLRTEPLRATVTVCGIAVGCALVVSSSSVAESFRHSIRAYVARTTVADLLVTCSSDLFAPSAQPMSPEVARVLEATPEVAEVQRVRVLDLTIEGKRADLFALDVRAWDRRVGFPFLRGDRRTAAAELAAGHGVAVSENFAQTFGFDVGSRLPLRTPQGVVELPVLGVFVDYSTAFGAVVIDRSVHQRYWRDDLTDLFHVYLKPGADVAAVQARLEKQLAEPYDVFVLTTGEVRARIGGLLDDLFLLIRLQDLVAIAVALLGLINTVLMAVLERRREIAVLRAVGGSRGQVTAAVVIESLGLAAAGALLGGLLGVGLGWINVDVVSTLHTGWRFDFRVNALMDLELFALIALAGIAAAWLPARRAAREGIWRGLAAE